jgi:Predicted membrane protein
MKFCTNCGSELKEGQDVCLKCGKVLSKQKTASTAEPGAKSKVAAGLLAIFLGCFGVHNFYLGHTGKAVAQLLMTVLSCGILSVVSWIWAIVEGIQILSGTVTTDAHGNTLAD